MSTPEEAADAARPTRVRKVRIDDDQAGQRIDNFLRRELPGVPRSRVYRILRKGEVRVNGGRVRADRSILRHYPYPLLDLRRGGHRL